MVIAEENIKVAVINELIARCRLTPNMVQELDQAIEDEIALSEGFLTVAQIATEVILQEKVAEF